VRPPSRCCAKWEWPLDPAQNGDNRL
jgi:hypothetical protein